MKGLGRKEMLDEKFLGTCIKNEIDVIYCIMFEVN